MWDGTALGGDENVILGLGRHHKATEYVIKSNVFTLSPATADTPFLEELPIAPECGVISYDPKAELLMGRVVNMSADESILGNNARIDADKAHFLTLDPSSLRYRTLGPVVGSAFHDGIVLSGKEKSKPFEDKIV